MHIAPLQEKHQDRPKRAVFAVYVNQMSKSCRGLAGGEALTEGNVATDGNHIGCADQLVVVRTRCAAAGGYRGINTFMAGKDIQHRESRAGVAHRDGGSGAAIVVKGAIAYRAGGKGGRHDQTLFT